MENRFTHYYFIGIGGIGMSALARYLVHTGKEVAGYDKVKSELCQQLENEGMHLHYQDDFESIPEEFKNTELCCVVYTPAITENFGELVRFRESGITLKKRSQLLGDISKTMTCLAVAGTHGKTTTSAILAHLLYKTGVKMTAFLGGILNGYNSNFLHSGSDVMVVEADEYDRSFMQLVPDVAGITAMDPDHLDIYGDEEEFRKTFRDFAGLVDQDRLYVNESVELEGKTVGIEKGTIHTENLRVKNGSYHFDLVLNGSKSIDFVFSTPGRHNLANALLAIAMATDVGIDPDQLREPLKSFQGVERRFSYRYKSEDLVLIDDYAHHPTEITAVHQAVKEMYPEEKITAIFQPHLFSRTRDFMDGFSESLSKFDELALMEIYPAREEPIAGINSTALKIQIQIENKKQDVQLLEAGQIFNYIKNQPNKIVLMIGAGDIGIAINKLTHSLKDIL